MDSAIYRSPVGNLKISNDHVGITGVEWTSPDSKTVTIGKSENENKRASLSKHLAQAFCWLDFYFGERKNEVDMPDFNLDKYSAFCQKVWRTLVERTRDGTTLTYSQLAELVGSPHAARAVGTAMKRNPIPLFIPCHRVLPKRGGMGSYSGGKGADTKKTLLDHESRIAKRGKIEE